MDHNQDAYNMIDAWQMGYDAAMYDGMDLSHQLPCKCDKCLKEYRDGEEEAFKEIFDKSK